MQPQPACWPNANWFSIDNIELNISSVAIDTGSASRELTTAAEYQRKAGKRAACLMLVLAIVVAVVLLAVSTWFYLHNDLCLWRFCPGAILILDTHIILDIYTVILFCYSTQDELSSSWSTQLLMPSIRILPPTTVKTLFLHYTILSLHALSFLLYLEGL